MEVHKPQCQLVKTIEASKRKTDEHELLVKREDGIRFLDVFHKKKVAFRPSAILILGKTSFTSTVSGPPGWFTIEIYVNILHYSIAYIYIQYVCIYIYYIYMYVCIYIYTSESVIASVNVTPTSWVISYRYMLLWHTMAIYPLKWNRTACGFWGNCESWLGLFWGRPMSPTTKPICYPKRSRSGPKPAEIL